MVSTESSPAQAPCLPDPEFREKLALVIPHLRAFARSLCGNAETADDLVQDAMLRAWAARGRFAAGTNFKAWMFTILRNQYFSQHRRKRFVGEWDEHVADRVLAAPSNQDRAIELQDILRGLQQVAADQREALILVAAGGLSYEEAADIVGVAVGTIKSRVCRARIALEKIMQNGLLRTKRRDFDSGEGAVLSILAHLEKMQTRVRTPLGGDSVPPRIAA